LQLSGPLHLQKAKYRVFIVSIAVAVCEPTTVAIDLMVPDCTSASVHAVSLEVQRIEYAMQTLPGSTATDCVWPLLPERQFNADTSLMQKPANAKRSIATEHLGVTDMRSVRWIRSSTKRSSSSKMSSSSSIHHSDTEGGTRAAAHFRRSG
jgi:hypothetical protein